MQERKKKILAWHFCGETLLDGRPIPEDGAELEHKSELVMCVNGLHASVKILDALYYAPGNTICRVACYGEVIKQEDKLVCSKRTVLWRIDAEKLLASFARQQALSVSHLWQMPPLVKEYLETGNEQIRAAASAAAWDAARAAANKQLTKMANEEHKKLLKIK